MRSIIAPGDVKERQAQPHVMELAADIRVLGGEPIHPLAVKKVRKGWQLISGRDRYSALASIGAKSAPVRVVEEATAQELHDLEVSENLHRRIDDRNALIAERVRQVTERVVAERASSGTSVPKPGRPKSAEGEARARVAAQLGTTPDAVKQAVRRAEVREEAAADQPAAGVGHDRPPPPIETFGHELPPHVREDLAPVLASMQAIHTYLLKAQAEARKLDTTGILRGDLDAVKTALHDALAVVNAKTPTHLCPYCTGVLKQGGCEACNVNGFVTRAVFLSAPAELRVGAEEYAAGLDAEPALAKTPGEAMRRARQEKRITVEVEGETLTVEELGRRAEKVPF